MRDVTPSKTISALGNYTVNDLRSHLMLYGDTNTHRSARMMEVAEKCSLRKRGVLLLTENNGSQFLANQGFLIFKTMGSSIHPKAAATNIITKILAGQSVVVNTNATGLNYKEPFIRFLLEALSEKEFEKITIVIDSVECYFPRTVITPNERYSRNLLSNILMRSKLYGWEMAFSSENPKSIAPQIRKSCGPKMIGLIKNAENVKDVSSDVDDTNIERYCTDAWGISVSNAQNQFIYNHYSSLRQNSKKRPANEILEEVDDDLIITEQSLTQLVAQPRRLPDIDLRCGYNPINPGPGPRYEDSDTQIDFDNLLAITSKEMEDETWGRESARKSRQTKVTAKAIANDNPARRKVKSKKPRTRLTGIAPAIESIKAAGIKSAPRAFACARTMMNSREDALHRALDGRMTATSVARRVIEDETMREIIALSGNTAVRFTKMGKSLSGVAYAAALYQAYQSDPATAAKFRADIYYGRTKDQRGALTQELDNLLLRFSNIKEDAQRAEAQYKAMMTYWKSYQIAATAVLLKKAA